MCQPEPELTLFILSLFYYSISIVPSQGNWTQAVM